MAKRIAKEGVRSDIRGPFGVSLFVSKVIAPEEKAKSTEIIIYSKAISSKMQTVLE